MAWLYQYTKAGKSRWFIGWRSGGKVRARSTRTDDRVQAEKQLAAFVALEAIHERGGPIDELYRNLKGISLPVTAGRSLKAELEEWVAEAKATTSPATYRSYRGFAAALVDFLGADDKRPLIGDITTESLRAYLADRLKRKSVVSVNWERKVLRVFFRRAVANGRINHEPAAAIKPFRATEVTSRRRPFTVDEVRLLQSKAEGFWKAAVLLGFYTGLRISDIATMPVGAVDLDERVIRLSTLKTGSRVVLPLPAVVVAVLRDRIRELGQPKPTDLLWPEYAAMISGQRSNEFHRLMVTCGLAPARTHKKRGQGRGAPREASKLSFHCLRHTFVSMLKATGSGQAVAKALAGHASDQISDHYTSLPMETLRAAVKALPGMEWDPEPEVRGS